ncbi:hypothetical protein IW261DRAFT_1624941 [Armillaria novae-zelandiae]|uniref:Uncharacterized protein n=1 Tax=Armillaria novae-zelandiae TaxID=153914 RepID=A0AA39P977_9AGAR|nr:hypothetical protein IW261DRAFT_1624941 [Armillaria novae-zelandiae]
MPSLPPSSMVYMTHDPTNYKLYNRLLASQVKILEYVAPTRSRELEDYDYDHYDEEHDALCELYSSMADWLKELWHIMMKDGADYKLISKCLSSCLDHVNDAEGIIHPIVFYDAVCTLRIDVLDEKKRKSIIYDRCTWIPEHLCWMYRELMVVAQSRHQQGEFHAIQSENSNLGLEEETKKLLHPREQLEERRAGAKIPAAHYKDAHWDMAMIEGALAIYAEDDESEEDEEDEDEEDTDTESQ